VLVKLVKVIVIYDTKYGNTKRVAELIAEGIGEIGGIKPAVNNFKEIKNLKDLNNYDVLLIGAPTHFGAPSKAIMKFIDRFAKIPLQGKGFTIFDTYLGNDFELGVKKIEQKILEKLPSFHKIAPGLSVKVQGMKGPIIEEDIPKCKEFGQKISSLLK
jgi:flavodoxin